MRSSVSVLLRDAEKYEDMYEELKKLGDFYEKPDKQENFGKSRVFWQLCIYLKIIKGPG